MFVQMESQTGEHSALLQTRRGWMTSTWGGRGEADLSLSSHCRVPRACMRLITEREDIRSASPQGGFLVWMDVARAREWGMG